MRFAVSISDTGETVKMVEPSGDSCSDQTESLSGKDEIVLDRGFLSHVVGIQRKYFELLNDSISATFKV